MGVSRAKILDSAVGSNQIGSDAVVAADIDETVAYDFSSSSNTFTGEKATLSEFTTNGTNDGFMTGNFDFPSGETSTVVVNSRATANSQVFFSFENSMSGIQPHFTTTSGSFTLNMSSAPGSDVTTNYFIIN